MKRKMILSALAVLAAVSCSKSGGNDYNSYESQRERIVSYVGKLTTSVVENDGVFVTRTNVNPVTAGAPRLTGGDSVWVNYVMYKFSTKPDSVFMTNIESVAIEKGFDTDYLSLEPLALKYGTTEIMSGFEKGLANSMEGDSLMMFIPSRDAYDNKIVGIVEKSTIIAIFADIKKIKKND